MTLLSFAELPKKGVPYTRGHIYKLIDRGQFPRPVKLGERKVAFVEREIDDWIRSKIEQRDAA